MTETEKKSSTLVKEILSKPYRLTLHNDDHNTFDWVIKCLIDICSHEVEQANQCAHLVHYKGKCDVKYGNYELISDMKTKMDNLGLLATIEVN